MNSPDEQDEMLPEYDLASMGKPERGMYAARYREGTNVVLLDADLAQKFHSSEEVNEALRKYLEMSKPS